MGGETKHGVQAECLLSPPYTVTQYISSTQAA